MNQRPDIESILCNFFTEHNCIIPEISLLQPAEPFLDMAGEELRRKIFMTRDSQGRNHCLRPEFTIPVCLHHITTGQG